MDAVELSWIQQLYCLQHIAHISLTNGLELDLLKDTVEDRYFRIKKDFMKIRKTQVPFSQVRKIAQIIENNDLPYNSFTKDNDYVIFKLDGPLDFNNDVQAACLPPSDAYLGLTSSGEQCFTSGWGTLQVGKNFTYHIVQNSMKKNRASDYEDKFHSFLMCRM